VGVYLALMDDRYPSTDEHQSVHLDYPYLDAQRDLNRWLPLVKWLLASPHQFVLFFLWIAAPVVVVIQPGHRDGSLTATACRSSHFTVPPAVLALVLLGAGVIPAHLLNLVGARSSEPWGADCFQAGRRPWGPSVTI
jgi:hypothetical protein